MTDLAALSSPEAAHLADEGALLAVPVASTEQHGAHLPLSTDADLAVGLCARLAESRPGVVVAPPLAYGSSGEHEGLPDDLHRPGGGRAGSRRAVPFGRADLPAGPAGPTHGGNTEAVRRAEERLRGESRDVCAWLPHWRGGRPRRAHRDVAAAGSGPAVGADNRARAGNTTPIADLMPALRASSVRAVSPNGVLGDPAGVSAEEGAAVFAALLADLLGCVRKWSGD